MNDSLLLFPQDHKEIYKKIRNYLAGRLVGATRDKALLEEVVKCLFCKKLILQTGNATEVSSDPIDIAKAYRSTFSKVKKLLPEDFFESSEILLDPHSLHFVDSQLSQVNLLNPSRDPIGDVYEAFIGSEMRGAEGQFFTPKNAAEWLVEAIDPKPGELIIDPACGAGGFLSESANYLLKKGAKPSEVTASLFGIEKDKYLAKLANAHIAITTLQPANILCGDSLEFKDASNSKIGEDYIGKFDVVLTNPPFGTKIVSASDKVRTAFDLAHKWKLDKKTKKWSMFNELATKTPPQVLFIERIISLLKPGGRAGLVLPESLLSSQSYGFVMQYMMEQCIIEGVVGMPENLFKSSGKGGTHTKTCLVTLSKREEARKSKAKVFMAEAKWCGNDSRGRSIPNDDLPTILGDYKARHKSSNALKMGYVFDEREIKNNILCPRYYDPAIGQLIKQLGDSHDMVSVQELLDKGLLSISTGDELGKLAYGTGTVPFVRTSDISNWEIKSDPKHCVSEDIYSQYSKRQDICPGDILMVRDGTYLIGSCAIVTEYDKKILYQSHILKIRSNEPSVLSPYLLLAIFSSDPVQQQIKQKRFTQDIIDSIGNRLAEVLLPIPKSQAHKKKIADAVKGAIRERIEARELSRRARLAVVDIKALDDVELPEAALA